jgi:hypothetical protein
LSKEDIVSGQWPDWSRGKEPISISRWQIALHASPFFAGQKVRLCPLFMLIETTGQQETHGDGRRAGMTGISRDASVINATLPSCNVRSLDRSSRLPLFRLDVAWPDFSSHAVSLTISAAPTAVLSSDPSAFVGCHNLHFGGNSLKIGNADLEETDAKGVAPSIRVLDEAQLRYERPDVGLHTAHERLIHFRLPVHVYNDADARKLTFDWQEF